jgi:hypothetical protein
LRCAPVADRAGAGAGTPAAADWSAGEFVLNACLSARGSVVRSGKLGTSCVRMRSAKLTMSAWTLAALGRPPEADELGEREPQPAMSSDSAATTLTMVSVGSLVC